MILHLWEKRTHHTPHTTLRNYTATHFVTSTQAARQVDTAASQRISYQVTPGGARLVSTQHHTRQPARFTRLTSVTLLRPEVIAVA